MNELRIGDDARDVLNRAGVGELVGRKNVVVYFYPKDFTPGCTREARDFRDAQAEFALTNTEIVGVSADSDDSHLKFATREGLTFKLVSDLKAVIAGQCGVKGPLGTARRTTFLVDRSGRVRHVWSKVRVEGHAAEVLGIIRELGLT